MKMTLEYDFPINHVHQMNVVYEHGLAGFPIWVGICKLKDLFRPRDCFRNAAWTGMVDLNSNLTVRVLFASTEIRDCTNFRFKYFRDNGLPYCNKNNARPEIPGNPTRVLNVNTGEIFPSQKDAAEAIGCTQAAMSRHMNRAAGAKTIRGMIFDRVQ